MKKVILAVAVTSFSCIMTVSAYAGNWVKNNTGWWYDNGNGTWPSSSWQWIDGNADGIAECYCFDGAGYCMINATTPDNYTVNDSGAWTVNGAVQTKSVNIQNVQKDDNYYMEKYNPAMKEYVNLLDFDSYDLLDINGNGSKELVLGNKYGENGSSIILAIYTLNNGTPVKVAWDPGVSEWYIKVLKGGYISISNTNASWDTCEIKKLDINDNVDSVSSTGYMHIYGEAEYYKVNGAKVSKSVYDTEMAKYNLKEENITLTRSFKSD